ncbi:MAG: YggT family protein [Candidatus Hydrogenedentes bacterium]|nr:YggT family protein [Candidatus Hydrogenedentota bacterium]
MMISLQGLPMRAAYVVFTLYMMVILLRWASVYLQLDLYNPRLRWIKTTTDPLINLVKRYVPTLGPVDFSVLVALLIVYVLRQLTVSVLGGLFV